MTLEGIPKEVERVQPQQTKWFRKSGIREGEQYQIMVGSRYHDIIFIYEYVCVCLCVCMRDRSCAHV